MINFQSTAMAAGRQDAQPKELLRKTKELLQLLQNLHNHVSQKLGILS